MPTNSSRRFEPNQSCCGTAQTARRGRTTTITAAADDDTSGRGRCGADLWWRLSDGRKTEPPSLSRLHPPARPLHSFTRPFARSFILSSLAHSLLQLKRPPRPRRRANYCAPANQHQSFMLGATIRWPACEMCLPGHKNRREAPNSCWAI